MGAIPRAPRRPGVVEDTGMCGSSLRGNRETPRPTTGTLLIWSASGRRGAVADDARTWGVRLRHSSCEADEQGGAIRCGAGGAKGGGRGECEPAKHAPGTVRVSQALGRIRHVARISRRARRPRKARLLCRVQFWRSQIFSAAMDRHGGEPTPAMQASASSRSYTVAYTHLTL